MSISNILHLTICFRSVLREVQVRAVSKNNF